MACSVALVGPPNVGKSSLLNALANRPAAIVSNIPGTTRDIVEVSLNVAGYVVRVTDTAGVRATDDAVEQEGVLRARQASSEADIRVCVFDATVRTLAKRGYIDRSQRSCACRHFLEESVQT